MKRIFVTGATGNLGRAVVAALVKENLSVRAGARDPGRTAFPPGVEVVAFDYTRPAGHAAALEGVEGLVLIAPPLDAEAPARLNPVISLAKARGVRQVVLVSAFGVDAVEQAPLRIIERHLQAAALPCTILRPNFFMENFSAGFLAPMVRQGAIYLAAGEGRTSFISVADIAEVAVKALVQGLVGRAYNLTGPEALDHAAVAALLSRVTGRPVSYQAIPEEAMFEGLRGAGMAESAVQYVGQLYRAVRAGLMATVTPDVQAVLGRPPVSFETFARRNSGVWA